MPFEIKIDHNESWQQHCARALKLDNTHAIVNYEAGTDNVILKVSNKEKQIEIEFSNQQLVGTLDDLNIYQHMKQLLNRDQSFIMNNET